MSRHAPDRTHRRPRRRRRIVLAAVGVLVVAVGAFALVRGPSVSRMVASAPLVGAECPTDRLPSTPVSVTVAPELIQTVSAAVRPLSGVTLPDHSCVSVTVNAQEPAATIAAARVLPADRAPDVWVPDSSLWLSRVPSWPVRQQGSFATSPVVIATSRSAVTGLGWDRRRPDWRSAVAGRRPLAVPRIEQSASGLAAVIAMYADLGGGDLAQQALAGAVLATGRAGVPTEQKAIAAAESGDEQAPLLPTTQQQVTAANAALPEQSRMSSVRPKGASAVLDYPMLSIGSSGGGRHARAVDAVLDQLRSPEARTLAQAAGYDAPVPAEAAAQGPEPADLAALVQRITLLTAPSRILVVFDLSTSMAAAAGPEGSRIQLAAKAARAAGDLMPDRAQVGLWGFSRELGGAGSADAIAIQPVEQLGHPDKGRTHRDTVNYAMATMYQRLGGNGTALYETSLKAMKRMSKLYQPEAGDAVVVFTDGKDENPGGASLSSTVAQMKRIYDPKRPVRLIFIGIGEDADLPSMAKLASVAGGAAYRATDPKELPSVLFKTMNNRPGS